MRTRSAARTTRGHAGARHATRAEAPTRRSIWNGAISFGLVTIPVRLVTAARDTEGLALHLLHEKDRGRIRNRRVCEAEDREVPWNEIVHGFEYERGQYAVVTDEELAALRPESTQTIEIVQFADATEVDPMLYDKPYYLAPERRGKRAYALLRETLVESGRLGIARVVIRTREHVAVLKPSGDALVLVLLRYAEQLLDARGLDLPPRSEHGSPAERRSAQMLLDAMTQPFDIAAYHDTRHAELEKLLAKRARGEKVPAAPAKAAPTNVVDLASVLERSLAAAKGKSGGDRRKGHGSHPAHRRRKTG